MLIFVFGSNLEGVHGKGAALVALQYGAVFGQGEGLQGDTYALPTKHTPYQSFSLEEVSNHVETFLEHAKAHPENNYFVSRVGCGLAGFTDAQICPLFADAPRNCIFSQTWLQYMPESKYDVYKWHTDNYAATLAAKKL